MSTKHDPHSMIRADLDHAINVLTALRDGTIVGLGKSDDSESDGRQVRTALKSVRGIVEQLAAPAWIEQTTAMVQASRSQ